MQKQSQTSDEKKAQMRDQVTEWIKAYQLHGDEEAQAQLVQHYTGLVETIARKYSKGKSYQLDYENGKLK